jgi:glycosyltransferase involved in cell wall biosynthesis
MRMRYGIFIRSIESARGAEKVAATLASGLAARGHTIDFLVEDDRGWLIEDLRRNHPGVEVARLRNGPPDRRVDLGLGLCALARSLLLRSPGPSELCLGPLFDIVRKDRPPFAALRRYVLDRQPDAVLSFLNYPNVVLLLTALLCRRRSRFIVSVRNTISVAAANNRSRWIRAVPRLMRRLFPAADGVVAPSTGVADDIVRITGLPRERIGIVYNPVFRPEIIDLAQATADHPWFRDGALPVILGVGKLKPQKDFPTLIRAFAQVVAERPARLVILGEGTERDGLLDLARSLGIGDAVDLPGFVQNPYPFYRMAALFVLSSRWEGLPNVLIEAMACGCPVVSTDCPSGPREILAEGALGPVVPVGDVEALADAMIQALSGPRRTEALTARARMFSLEQAIDGFEQMLTPRTS